MNFKCANCGFTGVEREFVEAENLLERLTPGDTFTNKECVVCGALAYPAPPTKSYMVTVRATVTKRMQITAENESQASETANQEFDLANNGDDEDYEQDVLQVIEIKT